MTLAPVSGAPEAGARDLEEVEWLPPAQFGAGQDVLLQTFGRAGDGAHVWASGHRTACAGGFAQPLHATWTPDNSACGSHGIAASGVGIISA